MIAVFMEEVEENKEEDRDVETSSLVVRQKRNPSVESRFKAVRPGIRPSGFGDAARPSRKLRKGRRRRSLMTRRV